SGRTSECSFNVVVSDEEPPCIGCDPEDPDDPFNPNDPQGISCESIVASMGGSVEVGTSENVNYYSHSGTNWDITYNDNSTAHDDIIVECTLSGVTTATGLTTLDGVHFNIGETTVRWRVEDQYGNSDFCEFTVTVVDDEDPCIGCDPTDPDDPFNPTNPDGVSCASIVAAMGGMNGSFEVNTTTNLNYYLHNNDNWNITANDNVGVASIVYTVSGVTTVVNGSNTTLNGQHFEIGTTVVTWTVTDVSGRTSECSFNVVVVDNEPPCIGCDPTDPDDPFNPNDPQGISCESIVAGMQGANGTVSVGTSDNVNYYIHYNSGEDGNWDITANDNVGIASIVCNLSGATTATGLTTLNEQHFNIGTTTVTWVVTDASTPPNTSTCSFTVIVSDDEPPCIGCDPDPSNPDPFNPNTGVSCTSLTNSTGSVSVNTMAGQTYYQHGDDSWDITANDNSGIESISYTLSGATTTVNGSPETLNGQRFNVGQTTVTWTARDIYGLTSTCTFTVNVSDVEPPSISCPQGIENITCISDVPAPYQTYAQFVAAGGSAYDANGIDESSFTMLSQISNEQTCPEILTRTYQISDMAGNTETCTQTITVMDNVSPVITGLAPTINVGQGTNCSYPLPDFTATVRAMSSDNCTSRENLTIVQNPVAGSTTMITTNTDVTITVTDACGNTAQIIGHAVVPQPLTHNVSFTEILCTGQTSTVTITGVGGTAPYNGVGERVEYAGAHSYVITDANGCTSNVNITIPEPQQLTTNIPATAVQAVACYGQNTGSASVSVAGGTPGYTYSWNTVPQQTTQTATALVAGRYTVTVTDVKGCTSTSAVTIEGQDSQLSTSFATSNVSEVLCYGEATGSATVTAIGGTPGYSYEWSTSPAQTVPTATNLTTGNYTVTVTDSHGCTSVAAVTIGGQSSPLTTSFASGAITDVACYGQSTGSASVTVTGGTPGYTYRWSSYPVQTTQVATNLPAGQYVVTVTDTHGCTSTATATVSGQSYPLTASFAEGSTVDVLCFGETTGSATVTASGGSPDYAYSWNTIPQQTTPTATNLPAGNYIVTVTDSHGCTTTSSARINGQGTLLSATFNTGNISNIPCYGQTVGSATVTVNGGTPQYLYAWNTVPVQTTQTAQNLPAGSYVVTVTDDHGCTTTASATITQPAQLEVSASSTNATCGATGGSVTAVVVGGAGQYTYSWNNSAGQSYSGARVTNIAPSTYNLTVSDYNGCIATAVASVSASGSLSARIDVVALPGCGNNISAGRLQAVAESGISPFSYIWSDGSTAMLASNLQAGSYSVTLTDSWGCSANATTSIEQQNDLEISVSVTTVSCFGENDASATVVALRGEPPYTYSWNNGANSAFLQNIAAGRYSITVTDANMCAKAETIEIEQPDKLMLESNVKPISCYGKTDGSIALNAIGGNQPYSFSIIMDDNFYSGNYLSGLPAGTYSLEVTDAHGCMSNNTIQLVEPEAFTSSYSVGMPSCSGNNDGFIEVSATGGTKPYMYGWDSYYSDVPLITGLRQGQYTISVVDANKCTYQVASIMLTDMAGDCIKIPNVFTPNGDGVNDTWIIENIEMFPDATVYVFNRWGQMLYKGTGKDEPWDGSYRGHYVPAGTYLYIVDLYQKTEAYKGTVTVLY
ncbi:MAG: HYR domain-containing protein, partial [Bacteroidales bacterium]|nr:HYR domain-containing protein [Bacteroidales bacterium]